MQEFSKMGDYLVEMSYVRAMDSRPPPAPARAWATLSLCCAAVLFGAL